MNLDQKESKKDIVDWDIVNWLKAIKYWENNFPIGNKKHRCLELGANQGGLSLWLASHKNSVLCSDIKSPKKYASVIHKKYDFAASIKYAAIDATNIPYENHFDIITFKS